MRTGPTELNQIQTDRHAWKERRGDPDKEEINIKTGDEGCVHRWWVEMLGVEDIKMERGSGVKAEVKERYRKKEEDRKRYYVSERDLEDKEEVDKEGNTGRREGGSNYRRKDKTRIKPIWRLDHRTKSCSIMFAI